MQSRLGIKILSRKAQVVGDGFDLHPRLPEDRIAGRPDHGPVLFDQLLRGAQMVVLVKIALVALPQPERVGRPGRIRLVAIACRFSACRIIFRHQPFIGVEEGGSGSADFLPQSPPKGDRRRSPRSSRR